MNDEEKTKTSLEAIDTLFGQFGENDLCKEALLDIILENIYGKIIPLPSETGQEGDQSPVSEQRSMSTYTIE